MHTPVLLQEVIDGLKAKEGEVILDATVGGGGHSEALCRAAAGARFVCLDADEDAIERSRERLQSCACEFLFYRMNYRHLDVALANLGIAGINRALFDLGLSSFQLEESGRGFSFMRDEPLEMTFTKHPEEGEITAKTILNEWGEETIATILASYGEERQARKIARRIVEARAKAPILTTFGLASIVESVVKRKGKIHPVRSREGTKRFSASNGIHPATKTFQAIRVAVNDEYQGLKDGLAKAWEKLLPGGRIAVISFHSMEDRVAKDFFRELGRAGTGKVITQKPIVPSEQEILRNPRSRSAKLRVIEKI